MKYRKKPVVVEAFRFGYDFMPTWAVSAVSTGSITFGTDQQGDEEVVYAEILTKEGCMRANYGDYIICGVKGEIYPCKPDIFAMTYEVVTDERA